MSQTNACAVPECGVSTPSRYHLLCDTCRERVEAAGKQLRPALLDALTDLRAEVDAWLAGDWAPSRRWVISGQDYEIVPIEDIVARMVDETAAGWGDPSIGFTDDLQHARWEKQRQEYAPENEPRKQLAWGVPVDSATTTAWREHLAPLVRAALEQALGTFPLTYAGREIKDALTRSDDYGAEDVNGAFEELESGSGGNGLSENAGIYLCWRYDDDPSIWFSFDPGEDHLWINEGRRLGLIPADILAIIDAANAAEVERRDRERGG